VSEATAIIFRTKRDMDEESEQDESVSPFVLFNDPLPDSEGGPVREDDGHDGALALLWSRSRPTP
jgi:hypothetical protein